MKVDVDTAVVDDVDTDVPEEAHEDVFAPTVHSLQCPSCLSPRVDTCQCCTQS